MYVVRSAQLCTYVCIMYGSVYEFIFCHLYVHIRVTVVLVQRVLVKFLLYNSYTNFIVETINSVPIEIFSFLRHV